MELKKKNLCCDLYRSPSWPVWAPRLPTLSDSGVNESLQVPSFVPSSNVTTIIDPTSNRFWPTSSPLTSRKGHQTSNLYVSNVLGKNSSNNGVINNNNLSKTRDYGSFKVPGEISKQIRKIDRIGNDISPKTVCKNVRNSGNIVKPRIGQSSWRNISKTCDYIEKGKTSPVLRLADQARAVSSPVPLHRPDTPRASSFIAATTAQTLR